MFKFFQLVLAGIFGATTITLLNTATIKPTQLAGSSESIVADSQLDSQETTPPTPALTTQPTFTTFNPFTTKIGGLTTDYFENLNGEFVTNINAHHLGGKAASSFLASDETDIAEATITFTAKPNSDDVSGGPLFINPSGSNADYTLFGVALNGNSRFKIDAEGDISIKGLAYSWPLGHGSGVLTNDGNGSLTWESAGASTDEKLKVSSNDTTAGFLNDKLVAGNGITVTENNDGGNETVTVASSWLAESTVEGRLTLTSNTPVTTTDVTSATTLYFTPFKGRYVGVYDGSNWQLHAFSELSLSLSGLTANTNFDIFIYDNAGTLTLQANAWADDTTRSSDLTLHDGIYVKSEDFTSRYIGTIRTTSSDGQTEDSETKRYVWNYYNRLPRRLFKRHTGGNYSYSSGTIRYVANDNTQKVETVVGIIEETITLNNQVRVNGGPFTTGIGVNSSSAFSVSSEDTNSSADHTKRAGIDEYPRLGYNYFARLERAYGTSILSYGSTGVMVGNIKG